MDCRKLADPDYTLGNIHRTQCLALVKRSFAYFDNTVGQRYFRYRPEKLTPTTHHVVKGRKYFFSYRRDRAFAYPRGNGYNSLLPLIVCNNKRSVLAHGKFQSRSGVKTGIKFSAERRSGSPVQIYRSLGFPFAVTVSFRCSENSAPHLSSSRIIGSSSSIIA